MKKALRMIWARTYIGIVYGPRKLYHWFMAKFYRVLGNLMKS